MQNRRDDDDDVSTSHPFRITTNTRIRDDGYRILESFLRQTMCVCFVYGYFQWIIFKQWLYLSYTSPFNWRFQYRFTLAWNNIGCAHFSLISNKKNWHKVHTENANFSIKFLNNENIFQIYWNSWGKKFPIIDGIARKCDQTTTNWFFAEMKLGGRIFAVGKETVAKNTRCIQLKNFSFN